MLKSSTASKGSVAILLHLSSSSSTETLLSNHVQMYWKGRKRHCDILLLGSRFFFFQYWDDLEHFHHQKNTSRGDQVSPLYRQAAVLKRRQLTSIVRLIVAQRKSDFY